MASGTVDCPDSVNVAMTSWTPGEIGNDMNQSSTKQNKKTQAQYYQGMKTTIQLCFLNVLNYVLNILLVLARGISILYLTITFQSGYKSFFCW